jgi:hypothetical protein
MRVPGKSLLWALLFFAAATVHAQTPAPTAPHVTFAFHREGVPVPNYEITLYQDGAGLYRGTEIPHVEGQGVATDLPPHPFERPIEVSSATATRVFTLAHQLDAFNKPCNSKAKNLADTGAKTLTYTGPDASGSCTFNYPIDKNVQALADTFQGIAETLDQGRLLDHLHRYDRLGLDAAMKDLADEVAEGRSVEIGTIAPTLHSIADDPQVMDRVRARANTLLASVPAARP